MINPDASCQWEIQLLGTEPKVSPRAIPSATRRRFRFALENDAKRNDGQ